MVQQFLQQCLISYLCGRITTIFYKRTFDVKYHLAILLKELTCLCVAWLVSYLLNDWSIVVIGYLAIVLTWRHQYVLKDDNIKCCFASLAIFVSFFYDIQEDKMLSLSLFIATSQFLRQPECMKEYLRTVRVICGPVYVIIALASLRHVNCSFETISVLRILATFSILTAAILFRPDNLVTFRILSFLPVPRFSNRKKIHGALMVVAMLANLVRLCMTSSVYFATFGFFNIALYGCLKLTTKGNFSTAN